MADLLEALDEKSMLTGPSILPKFGEWQIKGVKTPWFCEMALTDYEAPDVWPALWKTNMPMVTLEFMYKIVWIV